MFKNKSKTKQKNFKKKKEKRGALDKGYQGYIKEGML